MRNQYQSDQLLPKYVPDKLITLEPDSTNFFQVQYNHGPRTAKDRHFLAIFSVFFFSTFIFGIVSVFHWNPNSDVGSFSYDSTSSSCTRNSSSFFLTSSTYSSPVSIHYSYETISSSSNTSRVLSQTLITTSVLSIPIVFCFLLLLNHYAKQVVYTMLPLFIIVPLSAALYWFTACNSNPACSESHPNLVVVPVVVVFFVALLVWLIYANRHRIELTVRIIEIASKSLKKNLGLFAVLPAMFSGLVICHVPTFVFLAFASLNGEIVAKEVNDEFDCVWKQDSWVPFYYGLAIITMFWAFAIMLEAQVYVISGTISQWYFSNDGTAPLKKTITTSLRNAFGPSAGTICLSGLLYAVVRIVRAAVDNARKENSNGFLNLILKCLVNALVTAFDFLNKFTITFAAITGESYCSSAKMTYQLLKRNLLSAVFVETLSTRILGGTVFVLSAVYAVLVWGIVKVGSNLSSGESYFVAFAAWAVLIIVLSMFVQVMDNVIHTIYICYAMDKDKGQVCQDDVHQVFVHLHIPKTSAYPLAAAV